MLRQGNIKTFHPGKTNTDAAHCLKIRQCESICASPTMIAMRRGWLARAGIRTLEPGGLTLRTKTRAAAGFGRLRCRSTVERRLAPTKSCRADASMFSRGCDARPHNTAAILNNCVYSAPAHKAGQTDPAQQIRGATLGRSRPR